MTHRYCCLQIKNRRDFSSQYPHLSVLIQNLTGSIPVGTNYKNK